MGETGEGMEWDILQRKCDSCGFEASVEDPIKNASSAHHVNTLKDITINHDEQNNTVSVEGAVNTIRNILGDRSHCLTEPNIEAKKIVKSAVNEAPSVCCFDYKITKDHHANWTKARQALMNKDVEVESDDSDEEIDIDTSSRRLKKKVKNKKPAEKEKGKKKSENFKEKIEKVVKDEVKKKQTIVKKKEVVDSKGEDNNKKLFDSKQPKISLFYQFK